ncbi:tetratricopeptide repeat protein [Bordetella genomosp. 12]|uniref:tetratricopeptide repeat protein n=1 Tax=Bordetella genomosp. 12 TaxID=463035 RepID=UPI001ABEF8C0|nr:tetratricopeptide repeat protein [Bordetella genomosp. 12]
MRVWKIPAAGLGLALLGACASNNVDTAWQLMQQQQQEQALMQQKNDETDRQRAMASRPAMALSVIREAQQSGRYFASLAYLDAYRQAYGETPQVQVMRADALRMTGQTDSAEQLYRTLTGGEQAAEAWHGLGLLAAGRSDFAQAAQALARAASLRPTDAQYLGDLGYARLRAGDLQGARLPLGQAAELDPGNARILGNLALLLVLQGEEGGAQQVMTRGQLSSQARNRVYQLAAEIRRPAAVSAAPQEAARVGGPVVRAVPAGQTTVVSAEPASAMPMVQRPLLDRLGNPPFVQ